MSLEKFKYLSEKQQKKNITTGLHANDILRMGQSQKCEIVVSAG